ncbi:alpha/beta hydrolase [Burkholderia multivorans]|nr:alpha/beta hydrolase [Burkholderia multivorans]
MMTIRYFAAGDDDRRFVDTLLGDRVFSTVYAGPRSADAMRAATSSILATHAYSIDAPGLDIAPCDIAGVPCERIAAGAADRESSELIVFLHGGGFVRGSLALGRRSAIELAVLTRRPVLAIGYRQAPEHRFPAAGNDMLAVYRSLVDQGYDAQSLVVVGESSGGCLALTLPEWLRRNRCPAPAGIVGICPMADLRMDSVSWYVNAARDIATREMGARMIGLYIDAGSTADPLAAPLFTPYDATANVLLCVGANEVMLSDVERFADHAARAGATVALNLYEAMPHGFTKFDTPLARSAMQHVAAWCVTRLTRR